MSTSSLLEVNQFNHCLHPHYSKSINLNVVLYQPPRSDKNNVPTSVFLYEISKLFAALSMTPDHLLLTGDFNVHVDTPKDPTAAKLLSILESLGLVQHVTVPTHVAGHTLDLVITCELLTCSPVAHYMISSHSTVLFPLSMAKPNRPTIVHTCRKIKSIDTDFDQTLSLIYSYCLLQKTWTTSLSSIKKPYLVYLRTTHLRSQ